MFDTNLGQFVGRDFDVTGDGGTATVQLVSDEPGIATVRAFVPEDAVQSVNTVKVKFADYGIILTAEPFIVEMRHGQYVTSAITATLRRYLEEDGDVPTGDPLAGKEVTFSTSLGELEGPNPVATDENGQVRITVGQLRGGNGQGKGLGEGPTTAR